MAWYSVCFYDSSDSRTLNDSRPENYFESNDEERVIEEIARLLEVKRKVTGLQIKVSSICFEEEGSIMMPLSGGYSEPINEPTPSIKKTARTSYLFS